MNKKILTILIAGFFLMNTVFASDSYSISCFCLSDAANEALCGIPSISHSIGDASDCGGCRWEWANWYDCNVVDCAIKNIANTLGAESEDCDEDCDRCCAFGICVDCNCEYECRGTRFQGPTGSVICNCINPWRDCNNNIFDGCEINTHDDKNNCGGCNNVCVDTQYYDNEDGRNYWKTKRCDSGTCEYVTQAGLCQLCRDDNNDGICDSSQPVLYRPCSNIDKDTGAVPGEFGWWFCRQSYGNCDWRDKSDQDPNGCETNLNNNDYHCGECDIDCGDVSDNNNAECTGITLARSKPTINTGETYTLVDSFPNRDAEPDEIRDRCSPRCSGGNCLTSLTKETYRCNSNSDCVSNIRCADDAAHGEWNDLGWCCPGNMCGHDGRCYEPNSGIEVYNSNKGLKFFLCIEPSVGNAYWAEAPQVLHLGKLIEIKEKGASAVGDEDDHFWLGEEGITRDCIPAEYSSCSYEGPFYAQQYCHTFATSFDALFSLELGMKVPVQTGEFSLFNPYGQPERVFEGGDFQ